MKPPLTPTLSPRRGEGVFAATGFRLRRPWLKPCGSIFVWQSATAHAKSLPDTNGIYGYYYLVTYNPSWDPFKKGGNQFFDLTLFLKHLNR